MRLTITSPSSITDLATAYRAATLAPSDAALLLATTEGDCDCQTTSEPYADAGDDSFASTSDAPSSTATWTGVIGVEGELTGDGRLIEKNALRWENLPIPMRYAPEDQGQHGGAQVVGRILTITRQGNGDIAATGDFDLGSDIGREAARQVESEYTTGVSMDLDDVSFEIRIAGDVLAEIMDDDEPSDEGAPAETPAKPETDEAGRVTVAEIASDEEVMVSTSARVRAATIVAIPAFADARIALDSGAVIDESAPVADVLPILAGAAPLTPPAEWFVDPQLDGPTPLTIDEDGRVYGHLAAWLTCHVAYAGQCVKPPHSASGYAYFMTGGLRTAEGTTAAVGALTMDTLHADKSLSAARTIAHYENTGNAVAHVACGEDSHGIWVAGAVAPHITDEQIRALRASPISGDWRQIGGNLELQAALAVNVPGFPIPRPHGLVASGAMSSLVASGMLAPSRVRAPGSRGAFSTEDLKYLKRLITKARTEEREDATARADALAARVAQSRVQSMARTLGLTALGGTTSGM